ncbi:MAG: TetR/AcrR family transcriptional regulator, partial [Pseudomonadota bacterium]
MTRPSRHIDALLIKTARKLLPQTGCSGLNVRQVARLAKVNLGMFHYHFGSKEKFLKVVMQEVYEEFLQKFADEAESHSTALENLKAALLVFGKFARDNRELIFAIVMDLMSGNKAVHHLVRTNKFRHLNIISQLFSQASTEEGIAFPSVFNTLAVIIAGLQAPIL